jgi:hypothetical protein
MGVRLTVTYCPSCESKISVPNAAWYSILAVLSEEDNVTKRGLERETRRSLDGIKKSLRWLRTKS